MSYPESFNNLRSDSRVSSELPARLSIGSQLTLNGRLKDLSLKSAFIRIKHSVYVQLNDEVGFAIQISMNNAEELIEGMARISRIAGGEGLAIYFTRMEEPSIRRLKELLKSMGVC
ncbi:MAG: PilZ domain-containing protein [Candidatus Omnitrophica bacterium]|nr:PilZ domain-containing protein [Candidatus Omnitrophota bacterium]